MNILLLTQVLPYPLDSGPKIKTFHVLKFLSRRHNVTLVSFVRGDEGDAVRELGSICKQIYTVPIQRYKFTDIMYMSQSLVTGKPFVILRDYRRDMERLLVTLSSRESFDIVQADQLNMAQYAHLFPHAVKVLDAHNALWLLYQRLVRTSRAIIYRTVFAREWKLLQKYESAVANTFDRVITVSEEDRQALQTVGVASDKIEVIPITIDTDSIRPIVRSQHASNIVHIGTMFWPPNSEGVQWFLTDVWPIIRAERQDIEFDIIGSKPNRAIIELGRSLPGVNVWGYLENPTPRLSQAGAMIVPLRAGSGMRVKILIAMAEGIPVVSTSLGCEGIDVEDRKHLMIADNAADFARTTLRILNDRSSADQLAHQARDLIEDQYDYRVRLLELDRIYAEACADGR